MLKDLDLDDLELDKELGSGYISKVYLATHKSTHKKYAVKIVS